MSEVRKIRVLIADDHALVRSGLRSILETEPEIEVVGEAGDGHEALAVAQELLPDVILMDIKMGDWDGVTATRRVRNSVPSSRVIVLTNYDEDELVFSSHSSTRRSPSACSTSSVGSAPATAPPATTRVTAISPHASARC